MTLQWHRVAEADRYAVELSSDPFFGSASASAATADTQATVTTLVAGKKYYWRVQAQTGAGASGPWSDPWSFSTFIALPGKTLLVASAPIPNRADYIKLSWRRVDGADQYLAQLAVEPGFGRIQTSAVTADTVKNLSGTNEGQKYYWRVQAQNIAGAGPWSDVQEFTIVIAPTNLEARLTTPSAVRLGWMDRSRVEEGYVIERRTAQESVFTVLDTLKGSGSEYADAQVEKGGHYTWRIRAYKGAAVSEYSNEATLSLTGVAEKETLPAEYALSQNYPNPFNPVTIIRFALPLTAAARIAIFDGLGREVAVLLDRELAAGWHEIAYDARNLPSGVYLCRMQSGSFHALRKMILMK
ncbi:MAG TPA: T9SS type A sorting domain-containing protein [bacterium]|nr:T9SS type A sorting domain-containing protein [bacterium]